MSDNFAAIIIIGEHAISTNYPTYLWIAYLRQNGKMSVSYWTFQFNGQDKKTLSVLLGIISCWPPVCAKQGPHIPCAWASSTSIIFFTKSKNKILPRESFEIFYFRYRIFKTNYLFNRRLLMCHSKKVTVVHRILYFFNAYLALAWRLRKKGLSLIKNNLMPTSSFSQLKHVIWYKRLTKLGGFEMFLLH
jgi:hypothetical protein